MAEISAWGKYKIHKKIKEIKVAGTDKLLDWNGSWVGDRELRPGTRRL